MDQEFEQDKKNKIKLWIHKELKLDSQCVILLSEVNCNEDCEDKETLVIVLKDCDNAYAKVIRIRKCLNEISEENISNLLVNNSPFDKDHLTQPCSKLLKNLLNSTEKL